MDSVEHKPTPKNTNEMVARAISSVTGIQVCATSLYFKYQNRQFRCLIHEAFDEVQVGDREFDRWANSVGATVSPCPTTIDGMAKAISFLLGVHDREEFKGI